HLMPALQSQALIDSLTVLMQIDASGYRLVEKAQSDLVAEQANAVLITEITQQIVQGRLQLRNVQLLRARLQLQTDVRLLAVRQRYTQLQVTLQLTCPAPAMQRVSGQPGQWRILHQLQAIAQRSGNGAGNVQLKFLVSGTAIQRYPD